MDQRKKQLLLDKYGEIGICTNCGDFMIWQKQNHRFEFQGKELMILNLPILLCINSSCCNTGKNTREYELLMQKAKRRFYMTGETKSEADFLRKYNE